MQTLSPNPGTYALILRCSSRQSVRIGKLGNLCTENGYYVYVGSAFGPGGVRARIRHHLRISERPHWHMDYLRPVVEVEEVWFSYAPNPMEHRWAVFFRAFEGAVIPSGEFGSSDCRCESHLFFFGSTFDGDTCRIQLEKTIAEFGRVGTIRP